MSTKAVAVLFLAAILIVSCSAAPAPAAPPDAPAEVEAPAPAVVEPTAQPAAPQTEGTPYTFYWISHGTEGVPFWSFAMQGANAAAEALGVNVQASYHASDVASQKEAFMAAIAAKADGIAVSSPAVGVLNEEVALAHEKGIPVVFFNTDDPASGRDAFVGSDLFKTGQMWANYLVDNGLVKSGDFVWLPVEVPGMTYQTEETRGIASVFDPLGIEYEVFEAKYDPVETVQLMTDYLTANGDRVDAVILLGDVVSVYLQNAFENVGWEPGHVPVIGWGNSVEAANAVKEGYITVATWQYPDAQGFMPIVLLYMANENMAIGFDMNTVGNYDQSTVDLYLSLAKGMQ